LNNCLVALRTDPDSMIETLVKNNSKIKELITDFLKESEQNSSLQTETREKMEQEHFIPAKLLSHELRAPLQEIGAGIDLYKLDSASQTLPQLAKSLNARYKYLKRLIKKLPDIASGEKQELK